MPKRVFDILVSGLLLIMATPVLLALMVWIRLDSPGPALFRQVRVGRNGRPFQIFKLRSMVSDAPRMGSHMTAPGDRRITRAGRIIRRTSLDELPQLINVIKGDMSLVGPRPDTPMQEGDYSREDWEARHSVRPGITGLAQVRLRSAATPQERLELDLDYVRKQGFLRDLQIIAETGLTLFKRKAV